MSVETGSCSFLEIVKSVYIMFTSKEEGLPTEVTSIKKGFQMTHFNLTLEKFALN
jgi:hypothetical protein